MSKEIGKAPELRFKGFSDDWEQRKLGAMTNFEKGKGYTKKDLVQYGHRVILYGRLYTNYQTVIKRIDTYVGNNEGSIRSKVGDIIVPSSGESSEDISRASVVPYNGVILGGDINILEVDKETLDPVFVALTISNGTQKKELSRRAQGKTVVHLHNSDLKDVRLFFPSLGEQNKISLFFEELDNLIALHQEYLLKLDVFKKTLLGEVSAMRSDSKPKLRFAEFDFPWRERKLGDILEVNSGRDYKHLKEGNVPVYGTGGYMLSVNETLSNVDSIGIGRKGTIDKPQYLKAPFWTVDTLFFMTAKKCVDLLFCLALVNQIPWKKYDESTGVPSLSKINIEKINVRTPTYEEQKKIGCLYSQIEALITLRRTKIVNIQRLKKELLRKMFI